MTKLITSKILDNDKVAPGYFILKVQSPEIASQAQPGQFAHIRCGDGCEAVLTQKGRLGAGIILRRPFSFYKVQGENVSFLYQVTGRGTNLLRTHLPGEEISILGPLGNGFWFENNSRKKIMIAGGIGIAPFLFLIREMINKKAAPQDIILIYGAKREELLVRLDEFQDICSLYLSTDDGSRGFRGRASELLSALIEKEKLRGDYFACGPEEMLREIVEITKMEGSRVQVSLEERMGCGVGACLGCVKKINGKYLRICKDGPVFWGDEVNW